VTHILRKEIPTYTIPFIDDVPIKGPKLDYRLADGSYEMIPENPDIRRFVWEHLVNTNRILQRMRYSEGTFSGTKSILISREFTVLRHLCTPEGRRADPTTISAITNWGPCKDLSDVRAFLGTVG
ncbi:hypothetical protein FA95DRAFT_1465816, partial [Auriscalpium vulgare]